MKTQAHNKLKFNKSVVTELSNVSLGSIHGGSETGFEGDGITISRVTSRLCNSALHILGN